MQRFAKRMEEMGQYLERAEGACDQLAGLCPESEAGSAAGNGDLLGYLHGVEINGLHSNQQS